MSDLKARIALVIERGWDGACVEPPMMWPGDRRQIARRAREAALVVLGRDPAGPADIARALGIRVHCLPVADCGGEASDGARIIYRWSTDPAVRRRRVAHGLAHALLVREGWDHSETDALLLTLDLT